MEMNLAFLPYLKNKFVNLFANLKEKILKIFQTKELPNAKMIRPSQTVLPPQTAFPKKRGRNPGTKMKKTTKKTAKKVKKATKSKK